jgi:hypothetical protein
MGDYYDLDGNPMTLMEWAELMEADPERRRVGRTAVRGYLVSTVWLGMNHNYHPDAPPHIFETMVFPLTDFGDEVYCKRYSMREQAEAGHESVVRAIERQGGEVFLSSVKLGES